MHIDNAPSSSLLSNESFFHLLLLLEQLEDVLVADVALLGEDTSSEAVSVSKMAHKGNPRLLVNDGGALFEHNEDEMKVGVIVRIPI